MRIPIPVGLRLVLPLALTIALVALVGACSASGAEPWWQLSSGLRPSNLKAGLATDEVQELSVKGGGNFTLTLTTATGLAYPRQGSSVVNEFVATEGTFRMGDTIPLAGSPTVTAVGGESLTLSAAWSGGNIEVFPVVFAAQETTAAIPVGATPAEVQAALTALPAVGEQDVEVTGSPGGPYSVTFKGGFSDLPVALMQAGGSATVKVSELTHGRADGEIVLSAENLGDAAVNMEANPVTIADILPPGLQAVSIVASEPAPEAAFNVVNAVPCSLASLTCTASGSFELKSRIRPKTLAPYDALEIRIRVRVLPGASSAEENRVSVSGGGAPATSFSRPVRISEQSSAYGIEDWRLRAEEAGGALTTQAGSHPYQVTGTIDLNQGPDTGTAQSVLSKPNVEPIALSKNIVSKIPAGLIGDPVPIPRCRTILFLTIRLFRENLCPQQAAIGVASVTVYEPANVQYIVRTVPIFNLEPYYGEPARFGFYIPEGQIPVVLDTSLRDGPGEDYGVNITSSNISQVAGLISARVTLWGVPNDPRHDNSRGWGCMYATRGFEGIEQEVPCEHPAEAHPPGFLTMPTSCDGPLQSSAEADSWQEPNVFHAALTGEPLQSLDGCNRLPFTPGMSAEPTTDRASAPSGLDFDLDFRDEGLTSSEGIAQSQLSKTVVELPEGLTINPSSGVGLGACTPDDYARETVGSEPGAGCPNDSKLGTVEIETPLLTQKIRGNIFIAQPYNNPSKSLVALYVVAKNPEVGVLVKLAGKVEPNPVTGQLTTIFENNPQLAFNHFNFHFREGQQAPLISPPACGTYQTQALLTPWSEPQTVLTDLASFSITKGFDGGACPPAGGVPFNPGIEAGQLNNNAGSYSPFYLHLTRSDADQEISGFSTNLPSGLTGDLSGIPFCSDAAIEAARHKTGAQEEAEPSCSAASQVGHTLVGTGVGAVLAYVPGKIYLAGPFHGAPFSLVSVTSATVGPFDLGTVVLRFGLTIDPYTAQVSVTPTSSEPIPTILDGIVTHVRDIRVYIDRSKFTLNPTSCNPLSIGSTLTSDQGASKTVTSPFQASNCQALGFKPIFKVSTSGKNSRAKGASLTVKLSYPPGAQANISKVKVDLPKQLPSRLTTLQKACTAAQFNANPADCPAASRVGFAKAITPLIPVPLEGPAYFVSHGGEAFPSLIMVLQGYGVTINLVGTTFINKAGITSSTFKTVPDQPVGSFELTLPQGPYSALAANGNLCKTKLTMPTAFDAQNGAIVHQTTKITVTGCAKAKKAKKKAKKAKKAAKHHTRQKHGKKK
jgi:hypothetical protein